MNAFTSVRPRGEDAPGKLPKKTNHSRAPISGSLRDLPTQSPRDPAEAQEALAQTLADQALFDARQHRIANKHSRTSAEKYRNRIVK